MSATLRTRTFERWTISLREVKSCALNSANSRGYSVKEVITPKRCAVAPYRWNRTPALGRSADSDRGRGRGAQAGRVLSVPLHKRRGSSQLPESNTNP
jgi:hypothetical protein